MRDGKNYMERLGEVCLTQLKEEGFIEVTSLSLN